VSGQAPRRRVNYFRALWLLATGRTEAFALLGGEARDYLNSLAPLVAFMLVIGAVEAISGKPVRGLAIFLSSLCGLLAPPVIAEPLCRRWGCMDRWTLFANLLNWITIVLVPVVLAAAVAAILLTGAGLPVPAAVILMVLFTMSYFTWLQWFAARRGLMLSRWRSVQLLLAIQIGTGLLATVQVNPGADMLITQGLQTARQ
jgi:hypothetical protein